MANASTTSAPKSVAKPTGKPNVTDKNAKPKKEKVKRVEYTNPSIQDASGKFTAAPAVAQFNAEGKLDNPNGEFHPRLHLPIGSKRFAEKSFFVEFQGSMMELRGTLLSRKGAALRARAVRLRGLGDEKQQKAISKLQRIMKQRLELEAELRKSLGDEAVTAFLAQTAPAVQA